MGGRVEMREDDEGREVGDMEGARCRVNREIRCEDLVVEELLCGGDDGM